MDCRARRIALLLGWATFVACEVSPDDDFPFGEATGPQSTAASQPGASTTTPTSSSDSTSSEDPGTADETDGSQTESSAASTAAVTSSGGEDSSSTTAAACPLQTEGCPCDQGACEAGLACVGDTCQMIEECLMDLNEPNETEAEAPFLGTIDDWDQSGQMAFGVLEDADDVDWFHYFGTDEAGFIVDPERQLLSSGQARLCKYVECWNGLGQTEVTCPSGTTTDTSPDGRPGCCSFAAFAVPDVNCVSTIDEDLDVYVRIDQPSAACLSYTLQYHF